MTRTTVSLVAGVAIGVVCGFLMAGTYRTHASTAPSVNTEYALVLLDNSQAYFGKLQNLGEANPTLRDVFYIQGQTDPETKQVKNTLVKRGSEWHEPDLMVLDSRHIVIVEPVSPTSRVAKLIHDYKR